MSAFQGFDGADLLAVAWVAVVMIACWFWADSLPAAVDDPALDPVPDHDLPRYGVDRAHDDFRDPARAGGVPGAFPGSSQTHGGAARSRRRPF